MAMSRFAGLQGQCEMPEQILVSRKAVDVTTRKPTVSDCRHGDKQHTQVLRDLRCIGLGLHAHQNPRCTHSSNTAAAASSDEPAASCKLLTGLLPNSMLAGISPASTPAIPICREGIYLTNSPRLLCQGATATGTVVATCPPG
jgi:hypothetical protein